MIVIYDGRQTGRTTRLIELSAKAETEGKVNYIVVPNQHQAHSVFQQANEMGLNIGFPIILDEFLNKQYAARNIDHLLIDNADDILQRLSLIPIKAIVLEKSKEI